MINILSHNNNRILIRILHRHYYKHTSDEYNVQTGIHKKTTTIVSDNEKLKIKTYTIDQIPTQGGWKGNSPSPFIDLGLQLTKLLIKEFGENEPFRIWVKTRFNHTKTWLQNQLQLEQPKFILLEADNNEKRIRRALKLPEHGDLDDFTMFGVDSNCTKIQLKARYQVLIRLWHPDCHSNEKEKFEEANLVFIRIQEIYKRLEGRFPSQSLLYSQNKQ